MFMETIYLIDEIVLIVDVQIYIFVMLILF